MHRELLERLVGGERHCKAVADLGQRLELSRQLRPRFFCALAFLGVAANAYQAYRPPVAIDDRAPPSREPAAFAVRKHDAIFDFVVAVWRRKYGGDRALEPFGISRVHV